MTVKLRRSTGLRIEPKILVIAIFIVTFWAEYVLSQASGTLTDLYKTAAFSGSWEVFSKFNALGYVMQFCISSFSLLGLFLIAYSLLVTLLYKSAQSTFDNIHDVKDAGKGNKYFGMLEIGKSVYNGNHGTGVDAIINLVLSLAPDVRLYGEYNPNRMAGNLSDDDTALTYVLKTAPAKIILMFLFSIGFNGTLLMAYGNVAEAMSIGAETFVNVNLSKYVDRALNTGSSYKFGFSADGTHFGKFQQNLAKDIYAQMLRKTPDLTTENKGEIGRNVEKLVSESFKATQVDSIAGSHVATGNNKNDYDAKNLESTVIVNGTTKYDTSNIKSFPLSELIPGFPTGSFVHVSVTKKANSDETNYFEIKDKKSSNANENKAPSNQTDKEKAQNNN